MEAGGGAGAGAAGGAASGGGDSFGPAAEGNAFGITDSEELTQLLLLGLPGVDRKSCVAALAMTTHSVGDAVDLLHVKPNYRADWKDDLLDRFLKASPFREFGDEFIETMNIYLREIYIVENTELWKVAELAEREDKVHIIAFAIRNIFSNRRESEHRQAAAIITGVISLLPRSSCRHPLEDLFIQWHHSNLNEFRKFKERNRKNDKGNWGPDLVRIE